MKIRDLLSEDSVTPHGKMHPDHAAAGGRVIKSRDQGGYDRVYHQNRVMMAAAMSDGKSKKAVDMAPNSWVEKYNTQHPYTDEEYNMIVSAHKTVPSDVKIVVNDRRSKESDDVHRHSPIKGAPKFKRK
jgi:hypothetical protein